MDNQTNDQKSIKQTSTPPNSITTENPTSTITEIPVPETELPPLQPQPEVKETLPSDEYKNEYQDVLDQYAATQETPPPIIPPPTPTDLGITSTPPQNNIFKIVFIISLIVFVLTTTVLAFVYFKSQNNKESSSFVGSNTTETVPTQAVTDTCFLNDKTYQVGESFTATDGCNTCTCVSQNNVNCTDKECPSSKSATTSATNSTKTATSSSIPKDWQNYTDSVYKYSIQHPSNWIINSKSVENQILSISSPEKIKSLSNTNNSEGYSGDDINIQFYKDYKNSLTKNKSVEVYLSDKTYFLNYSKTKIGSLDGYKATELGMAEYPNFYIIKNNDLFIISSNIEFSKIELQIVNSFVFN
jgi:hypothetical protein